MRILLFKTVEKAKWDIILSYRNIFAEYDITVITGDNMPLDTIDDIISTGIDLIIYTLSSTLTYDQISHQKLLETTRIPVIIVERLDSAITWFRSPERIPSLKAVIKNRTVRDEKLHNAVFYRGRYHYALIFDKNVKYCRNTDSHAHLGMSAMKKIDEKYLGLYRSVTWDFYSSWLNQRFNGYFMDGVFPVGNWKSRTYDVFCVTHLRKTVDGVSRRRARDIINGLTGLKVITSSKMDKKEYDRKFSDSRICVACWGYGEWIHMDGYAMRAGVVLIKPDSDYVDMYPDLYQSTGPTQTYVSCKPDFSDLEQKIRMVLDNYDTYVPMLERNQKWIASYTPEVCTRRFCQELLNVATL